LLVNHRNVYFLKNVAEKPGELLFENKGSVSDEILPEHSTCPTIVDWDQNGVPDLLVGAEDGYFYYFLT